MTRYNGGKARCGNNTSCGGSLSLRRPLTMSEARALVSSKHFASNSCQCGSDQSFDDLLEPLPVVGALSDVSSGSELIVSPASQTSAHNTSTHFDYGRLNGYAAIRTSVGIGTVSNKPQPQKSPVVTINWNDSQWYDKAVYNAKYAGIIGSIKIDNDPLRPKDERSPVKTTNTSMPYRLAAKITVTNSNGTFTGSGFLVGPRHIVTAAHVLRELSLGQYNTVNAIEMHGSSQKITVAQRYIPPEFINLGTNPASEDLARWDFAMIRTNEIINQSGPWFKLVTLTNKNSLWNKVLYLIGFPGAGRPCGFALPKNPAKFDGWPFGDCGGGLYYGVGYCINTTLDSQFQHNLDQQPGTSGGPLYESLTTVRGIASYISAKGNFAHRLRKESIDYLESVVDNKP
jgi:V8-like Glu-specific endopeptidase